MKKYRKKQNKYAILLFSSFIFMVTSIILNFTILDLSVETKLLFMILLLMIWGILLFYLSIKLRLYTEYYQLAGLKEMYEGPITNKYDTLDHRVFTSLQRIGFSPAKKFSSFDVIDRHIEKANFANSKRGILEIVLCIYDDSIGFYDEKTDEAIYNIENSYRGSDKKYSNYFIYPIKIVDELTEEKFYDINKVTIEKNGKLSITVLPIFYERKTNQLYFLNSSFNASPQYEYAKNFIKSNFS